MPEMGDAEVKTVLPQLSRSSPSGGGDQQRHILPMFCRKCCNAVVQRTL